MKNLFDDLVRLLGDGYVLYSGEVDGSVYAALNCRKEKSARWLLKTDGRTEPVLLCLGCSKRCGRVGWEGFQLMLPRSRRRVQVVFADVSAIPATELLDKVSALRIDEAAAVLACSTNHVRHLLDEGVLDPIGTSKPIRVSAESIRRELRSQDATRPPP